MEHTSHKEGLTNPAAFFAASVPVFIHYNTRIIALLNRIEDETVLTFSLAENALTTGDHLKTAQGYVLRVLGPLTGQEFAALEPDDATLPGLIARSESLRAILDQIVPADFAHSAEQSVTHQAGFAETTQSCTDFLTLYGLPNFFFHLCMGYAGLRYSGVEIGKSDFDDIHTYPAGFHW